MVFSSNELDMLILQNGEDGNPSDSRYTWVKYSQHSDGKNLTDDPTDAIYIGIAYNKLESLESNNPLDYTWIKIKGDKGYDAYTIILTNENISFAVSNKDKISLADQTFFTDIIVMQGGEERTDFVIGEITPVKGISITKDENTVTMSVKMGISFDTENGYIRIPISIDGKVFFKDVMWNLSKQGEDGEQGQPALSLIIGNEMQNIPCTNDGIVLDNVLINIPFTAHKGFNMVSCTATVGLLPNGMTLGTNTSSTEKDSGLIVLNVAKGSELGGKQILTGDIEITFTIDGTNFKKIFSWSKTKDGGLSTVYTIEPSSYVMAKNFDDTLSPSSITFKAFYQENGISRTSYLGRFIIEETENGITYTNKYLSSTDESEIVYAPSSSSISSIRCSIYESGSVTKLLDRQSITILKDIDNLKPEITEIKTSISGVDSKVDAVNKSITNKVWNSDITTAINNYDGSTVKIIRDQVAEQKVELGKITNKVSDVESTFSDGLQTLTEKVSKVEQTAEGFQQTVEKNYATKTELGETTTTLRSEIKQEAGLINQTISTLDGTVSQHTQTLKTVTTELKTAQDDISRVEQTATSVKTEVENARGDKTSLAVKINGIETVVKDSEGKVAILIQDSEGFRKEINGINGDITQITETAGTIQESVSDIDGRVTDVETKAGTIETNLSDANGKIAQILEDAEKIKSDLKDTDKKIGTSVEQTAKDFNVQIKQIQDNLNNTVYKNFKFDENGLTITSQNSNISLRIDNSGINFYNGKSLVAYINSNKLHITDATVVENLQLGAFGYTQMSNGSLTFGKL